MGENCDAADTNLLTKDSHCINHSVDDLAEEDKADDDAVESKRDSFEKKKKKPTEEDKKKV